MFVKRSNLNTHRTICKDLEVLEFWHGEPVERAEFQHDDEPVEIEEEYHNETVSTFNPPGGRREQSEPLNSTQIFQAVPISRPQNVRLTSAFEAG